ncbi:hypothetical protein FO519_000168 [Halicephalobus sp. NKZ332]|nr:hypothetical protein FO519_000168 [Halicephalobus sp. NKZ332]
MIHILQSMMSNANANHGHSNKKYRKRHSSHGFSSTHSSALGVARILASRSSTTERLSDRPPTPPGRRINSKFSRRDLNLEDDQIEAVCDYFNKIPNKYEFFEKMFLQLFLVEDPELAPVFGLANIGEKEMKRRNAFRTHVCKFQRFLTTVVDLLPKKGREAELIQIIRMVGRQHCNIKSLSFTAARWMSFKSALISALVFGSDNEKASYGWNVLIGFLIYEIKDAYLAHIRHVRSNSVPHVLEAYRLEFHRKSVDEDPSAE